MRLCDLYGDDIVVIPNLCSKVGNLLADPQLSVRQCAIDTLVKLSTVYGTSLLVIYYFYLMNVIEKLFTIFSIL
jgi:hypothetical protein